MDNIITYLKFASAGLCSFVTYMWGGLDAVFTVLLCLIAVDYITGVLVAINAKNLSSEIGFRGILKKVGILCVVAVAQLLGGMAGVPDIRSFVIGFYIANEAISITENAGRLGVPLPKKLLDVLKQLSNEDEDKIYQ